jgi:integrase
MPYSMSNGKWRAKKMIHGMVRTRVFATKHEAQRWEALQDAAVWANEGTLTPTVSLLEFASAYLAMAEERFSRDTLDEKRLSFKRVLKLIAPDLPMFLISPAMVQAALRIIAMQTTGNAANKARKNLAADWTWGKKYFGLPSVNPFLEVDKMPADEHPRYVPSEEDFWKVYNIASPPDKVLLLAFLHTGARRGELFRLTWNDIDLKRKAIRLSTRKTGHGGMQHAWVALTDELYEALLAHKEHNPSSPTVFFAPRTGKGYHDRQKYMHTLCDKAGVKPFGFHAIRHLSATLLAYGGIDLPTIQAVLRHKNPNTTARYIKALTVAHEKLNQVFGNRKGPAGNSTGPFQEGIGT